MILGRNLLAALGLDLKFSENVIIGVELPYEGCSEYMVDVSNYDFTYITDKTVKSEDYFIKLYLHECLECNSTISSTRRMCRILDAKYKSYDLNKVMDEQFQHLNATERYRLLNILNKSKDLFDSTLGTWNTTMVDLELKDDAKPVCLQPYPVPRVHKSMFKQEVKRLVSLGVLEEANNSKWGAPYFAQPKAKTNHVRFLSDFRSFNGQLIHKPYPMPKICEILLNLEGFLYATSLDLNMGYYNIPLSEQASNICVIILP